MDVTNSSPFCAPRAFLLNFREPMLDSEKTDQLRTRTDAPGESADQSLEACSPTVTQVSGEQSDSNVNGIFFSKGKLESGPMRSITEVGGESPDTPADIVVLSQSTKTRTAAGGEGPDAPIDRIFLPY